MKDHKHTIHRLRQIGAGHTANALERYLQHEPAEAEPASDWSPEDERTLLMDEIHGRIDLDEREQAQEMLASSFLGGLEE